MWARSVIMAVLITFTALSWGQTSDSIVLREDIAPDNSLLVYQVTCEAAEASPPWNPQESLPPLSMAAAIRIAIQWASTSLGSNHPLAVSSIELAPIQSAELTNRWFYSIALVPEDRVATTAPYLTTVVILMNGTVIVPSRA